MVRCATQHAKEYVLRDEIKETATGFVLPFRAFRFKQGEAVKIECEVKYCEKCKKVRFFVNIKNYFGNIIFNNLLDNATINIVSFLFKSSNQLSTALFLKSEFIHTIFRQIVHHVTADLQLLMRVRTQR